MARFPNSSTGSTSSSAVHPAPGWHDRSSVVDGNALAGPLAQVFAADATTVVVRCAACGHEAMLAEVVVEADDAAFIARCRSCTHTLFVLQPDDDGLVMRLEALGAVRVPG